MSMKRLLSLLLAIIMVVGMIPAPAYAAEASEGTTGGEVSAPAESVPSETITDESTPDVSEPDESIPDESVPDESVPDESVPDESVPDESVPDESVPDEPVPDEPVPDESVPDETTCAHNYQSVTTNPTCTAGGYTTHTCTDCGDSYVTDEVDALGHDFSTGLFCANHCGERKELPALVLGERTTVEITVDTYDLKAYYTFTPEKSQSYTFASLCADGTDTWAVLYDSDMNWLADDEDSAGWNDFAITYYLEAGKTYVLRVQLHNGTGSFPISVSHICSMSETSRWEATCTEPGVITYTCTCGDGYKDTIPATGHSYYDSLNCLNCGEAMDTIPVELNTPIECQLAAGEVVYFAITPETYCYYAVHGQSSQEVWFELYDSTMNFLTQCTGTDFVLSQWLDQGETYIVKAYLRYADQTGSFRLNWYHYTYRSDITVESTCQEHGEFTNACVYCSYTWTEEKELAAHIYQYQGDHIACQYCNQELTATPIAVDERLEAYFPGNDYAYFSFTPERTCTYTFTSHSARDTFATLMDSYMSNVSSDDDSGESMNFAITALLEAGKTYYLRVQYLTMAEGSFGVSVSHYVTDNVTRSDYTAHTDTEEGSATYTCNDCGYSWTQLIPAGHVYTDGLCDWCDKEEIVSGTCGENAQWELNVATGALTVSGTGDMYDYTVYYDSNPAPWAAYRNAVKTVVIGEGITAVGEYAFADHDYLSSVSLPSTLKKIGYYGFWECQRLSELDLPEGLTSMGDMALAYTAITGITLPTTLTEFNPNSVAHTHSLSAIHVAEGHPAYTSVDGVLYTTDMTTLVAAPYLATYVEIPEGVTTIGESAFYDSKIKNVSFPSSLTTIKRGAFSSCSYLKSVVLPDSVTSLGFEVFRDCNNLTEIVLPVGLDKIADYTFYCCNALQSIVIPVDVSYIGTDAFGRCESLRTIRFLGNAPVYISSDAFYDVTANVYYPADDATWAEEIVNSTYGGNLNWIELSGLVILEQPNDTVAEEGRTTVLSVSAHNAASYQWQYSSDAGASWHDIDGAYTAEHSFTPIFSIHNGNLYRCQLTDDAGNQLLTEEVLLQIVPSVTYHSENLGTISTVNIPEGSMCVVRFTPMSSGEYMLTFNGDISVSPYADSRGYHETGTMFTLVGGEEYVFKLCGVSGETSFCLRQPWNLTAGESIEVSLNSYASDVAYFTPAETGMYYFHSGILSFNIHYMEDGYEREVSYNNMHAYELTAGVTYIINLWNQWDTAHTANIGMYVPQELAVGETVNGYLFDQDSHLFYVTPEVSGKYHIDSGMGTYVYLGEEQLSCDEWQLYDLEAGKEYLIQVYNYYGGYELRNWSLIVAEPEALEYGFDREVTLDYNQTMLFTFTPEISTMYTMVYGSNLDLSVREENGAGVSSWHYPEGRGFFLTAGETYYLRLTNYNNDQPVTTHFRMLELEFLAPGQTVSCTGEQTRLWIEVEESGLYKLSFSTDLGYSVFADDGKSVNCSLNRNEDRLFYLEAGTRYTLSLHNHFGHDTYSVCFSAGDALGLGVTQDLMVPSNGLALISATAEESGYYVIRYNADSSFSVRNYRDGNFDSDISIHGVEGGWCFGFYLEAGQTRWFCFENYSAEDYSCSITLEQAPAPNDMSIYFSGGNSVASNTELRMYVNFMPGYAMESFTVDIEDETVAQVTDIDDNVVHIRGMSAGSTKVTVTSASNVVRELTLQVLEPVEVSMDVPTAFTLESEEQGFFTFTTGEDYRFVLCLDEGVTWSMTDEHGNGYGTHNDLIVDGKHYWYFGANSNTKYYLSVHSKEAIENGTLEIRACEEPRSLSLPETLTVYKNDRYTFFPDFGTPWAHGFASWLIEDEGVSWSTFNSELHVEFTTLGEVTLTVSYGEMSATCVVTVMEPLPLKMGDNELKLSDWSTTERKFTPDETGFYVIDCPDGAHINQVYDADRNWPDSWTDANYNSVYLLQGGVEYTIGIYNQREERSATVTIGVPESVAIDSKVNVQANAGGNWTYVFEPAESGLYTVLYSNTHCERQLWNTNDERIDSLAGGYYSENNYGHTYLLEAGQKYLLTGHFWGGAGSMDISVIKTPAPTGMDLGWTSNTVNKGSETYLYVDFEPGFAAEDFTVSFSDPSVAKVSRINGREICVIGLAAGTTQITVTTASGFSDFFTLNCVEPIPVELGQETVFEGLSGQQFLVFTPEESGYYVVYSSNDKASVYINGASFEGQTSDDNGGLYTYYYLGEGQSFIVSVYNNYQTPIDVTCIVDKCQTPTVISIPEAIEGIVGGSIWLSVKFDSCWHFAPYYANLEGDCISQMWSPSGIGINLDSQGTGTVTVKCYDYPELSATCTVTVKEPDPLVVGNNGSVELPSGEHYKAKFTPEVSGWYSLPCPDISIAVFDGNGYYPSGRGFDHIWFYYLNGGTEYTVNYYNNSDSYKAFDLTVGVPTTLELGGEVSVAVDERSATAVYFKPAESGAYTFATSRWSDTELCVLDANGDRLETTYAWDAQYRYMHVILEEGQQYMVVLHTWYESTYEGTISVEKAEQPTALSVITYTDFVIAGDYIGVEVAFEPETAFTTVTWSVSDPEVAEITYTGRTYAELNAIKPGTVIVTATTASGLSASATVEVKQTIPVNVTVDGPSKVTLPAGDVLKVQCQYPAAGKYTVTINSTQLDRIRGWFGSFVTEDMMYCYVTGYEEGDFEYIYMLNTSGENLELEVCMHEVQSPESVRLSADKVQIRPGHVGSISVLSDDPLVWAGIKDVTFETENIAFIEYFNANTLFIYGYQIGTTVMHIELDNGQTLSCEVVVSNTPIISSMNLGEPVELDYEGGFDVYYSFTPETSGYYAVHADVNVDTCVTISYGNGNGIASGDIRSRSSNTVDAYLTAGETYVINIWSTSGAPYYKGSFWIDDDVKTVTGLEITQTPYRDSFVTGYVLQDLEGLEMTVTWSDGTTTFFNYERNGNRIGNFLLSMVDVRENEDGTADVILGCCDATVSYRVTLKENTVVKLDVIDDDVQPWPDGAHYIEWSGTYYPHHVTKDIRFLVTFIDGTSQEITFRDKILGYQVSVTANKLTGLGGKENTLEFSLLGQSVVYTVEFMETTVDYLEIVQGPNPLIYGEDDRVTKSESGLCMRLDYDRGFEGMIIGIHYTDGRYEEISYADMSYPGGTGFLGYPEHNGYKVEAQYNNAEFSEGFVYFVGNFPTNENGAVPMILHYMGKYVTFEVPLVEPEDTTPYLSFRWVDCWDNVWYENGEMDDQRGFGMCMLDEYHMIFYINYVDENGNWVREPVEISTNEYLVATKLTDLGETVEGDNGAYYYRIQPVAWDTLGVVSYDLNGQTVTMECDVWRGEYGFYTGPEMTNENYIRNFHWDPDTADNRVFYFGMDKHYSEEKIQWTITDLDLIEGSEFVDLELLDNGMYKITVHGDMTEPFGLHLRVYRTNIHDPEWTREDYFGIWCYPGESKKPYLSFRWLDNWGEGWFENGENGFDRDSFSTTPYDFHFMVFYLNYVNENGEWVREPVNVTANEVLTLHKLTELEGDRIAVDAQNSEFYYRVNSDTAYWDYVGEITYQYGDETLMFHVPVQRPTFGYYSEPNMTNESYLNSFEWDPDSDERRVFYFGADINNDWFVAQLYAIDGANYISIEALENGMYEITVNPDVDFSFGLCLEGSIENADGWRNDFGCGIDCHPGESKKPYISSHWLDNWGEGWFEISDPWFDRSISLPKGHERWLVFYVNYLDENGIWTSEQIDVTSNDYLALTKVTDMEYARIADGYDGSHYYRINALEWGEGQIYYVFNEETLVFEMPVVRDSMGFYSEPEMTNDTYLDWYEWDPDTDDARVFYFGMTEDWWTVTDVYANEGADRVSIEALENGMYQITVNGDVEDGFWLDLHVICQNVEGWSEERGCGIECRPGESKKPYLSYRWLSNWGEGWFENEEWAFGRDSIRITPIDEAWVVFYLNYQNEDGEWVSEPVEITHNDYIQADKVIDLEGEMIAEDAVHAEYYYRITTTPDHWDMVGLIGYGFNESALLLDVNIKREVLNYYSEPVISNETYINRFYIDTRAEENALYLGLELDGFIISDISATNQETGEPMSGGEMVRDIQALDNGMYKIVLDNNVTESFALELNVFVTDGKNMDYAVWGIWCEPMEVKDPHLGVVWLEYDEEGYVMVNPAYYSTDPFQTTPVSEAPVMFVMNTYNENGELVQTPVKVTGSEGLVLNSLDPAYYNVREDDPYAEYYVAVSATTDAWDTTQNVSYVHEGQSYSIDVYIKRDIYGLYTGPEMTNENYATRFYYDRAHNAIWVGLDGWTLLSASKTIVNDNGEEVTAMNSHLYEMEVSGNMVKFILTEDALDSREEFFFMFYFTVLDEEGNELKFGGGIPCYPIPVKIEITKQPENVTATVGDTAIFSVEATGEGLTYQWQYSKNGDFWGNYAATGAEMSIKATQARNGFYYRCQITDAEGNTVYTNAAQLTVEEPKIAIEITKQPENVTATVGDAATFSVEATGEGLTYQWQYSKNSIYWGNYAATGAEMSVKATEARNGYFYRCVITDDAGNEVTTNAAQLTVEKAKVTIEITKQPENVTATVGSTATFSVEATGEGLTYQWQYSKNSIYWGNYAATGAEMSVKATEARNGYFYRCVITDDAGNEVTTNAAQLTVEEAKVTIQITKQPENVTATVGSTANFSVEATGEGLTYQWQFSKNGSYWGNYAATGAEMSIKATEARNGYFYRCVITDEAGNTVTTNAVQLTVAEAKDTIEITKQPEAVTATVGSTATFSVEATGEGLTYQWQFSKNGSYWGAFACTSAEMSVKATEARNGYQYRCVITDAEGNTVTTEAAQLTVTK